MVTNNGRPFCAVDDSGFRKIINPLLVQFGPEYTINVKNVKENIITKGNLIIKNISEEVKGKLLSLKLDCVTRQNRSILGINVQYMDNNDEVVLKTLAMTQIDVKHTSENLKHAVCEVLKKFNITKNQIFSITCDNANNLVKLTRILREPDATDYTYSESDDGESDMDNVNVDANDVTDGEPDSSEEMETQIFEDVMLETFTPDPEPLTKCIRCSAHTVQCCVIDALKLESVQEILKKVKSIVKKLRTRTFMVKLKKRGLKMPKIDIEPRWNTSYDMLVRFLEHKTFCQHREDKYPELKLDECDWVAVSGIVKAL
ncbi:unnamed protein product [Macrosiphum euphorbiae]|uniref:Uncharacterized protein n=1 Tax=Macrosiphum euphorbiae TaxID=13131 RepID=A0AAV0VNP0_9HEMI|nr:unnamed protein product [Macrosiphum euphorbiae]